MDRISVPGYMSISVPAYGATLTNFPSPVMRRSMGRPALNLEETKVRLNAGQKERIIALVGEQRMSAYIRETLEKRLLEDEAAAATGQAGPGNQPMPSRNGRKPGLLKDLPRSGAKRP